MLRLPPDHCGMIRVTKEGVLYQSLAEGLRPRVGGGSIVSGSDGRYHPLPFSVRSLVISLEQSLQMSPKLLGAGLK
jgi:hypothetical protein